MEAIVMLVAGSALIAVGLWGVLQNNRERNDQRSHRDLLTELRNQPHPEDEIWDYSTTRVIARQNDPEISGPDERPLPTPFSHAERDRLVDE